MVPMQSIDVPFAATMVSSRGAHNSLYSDNLCELITYFVSGSDNIVIFGDFNLPDIQWSSYSYPSTRLYQSFMDCIIENALRPTQHVIVPTRGTNVLDQILSTDPMVVSRVTAGDHFRFLDKVVTILL